MASLRQIRSQIKSVQGTQQIMRAMQMVSASKLQRAQGRLVQTRPSLAYLDALARRLLADQLAAHARQAQAAEEVPDTVDRLQALWARQPAGAPTAAVQHPFFDQRQPRGAQTLVVVTSDTGLCSTYNTHLIAAAERFLDERSGESWNILPVGKRGARHFAKQWRWPMLDGWLELGGRPHPATLRTIGETLIARFLSRSADAIAMAYTRFVSPMVYRPAVEWLLPVELPAEMVAGQPASPPAGESANPTGYIYEPTPQRVLETALPLWAETKILVALLEAFTSEHSARMIAMKNASDNAKELANSLTRQRNKIRQASITRELAEIVGTAEALK